MTTETKFIDFIKAGAQVGHSCNKKGHCIRTCKIQYTGLIRDNQAGDDWYYTFIKLYPSLCLVEEI
jgi:hypothetical protein